MIEKLRPEASIYYNRGNDGRDGYFDIEYECPKCGKRLIEFPAFPAVCSNCGTYFDWSKKAHIVVKREIEWK